MNTMYDRVMIIVWKWSVLADKTGDKVFDFFETTGDCKDLIIRINEIKCPLALTRLYRIIGQYPDAKKILLLHREHGYTDDDLRVIIEKTQRKKTKNWLKCFLFTGGTDAIYYTLLSEGLIDGDGDFMNGIYRESFRDENGKRKYKNKEISVLSEDERFVLEKYFKNVWIHYEFEFKKKIDKLKVDFLSYFVEIPSETNNEQLIYSQDWIDRLQQNRKLYLRLRSFLGVYNRETLDNQHLNIKAKNIIEIKELQKAEKEDKLSYHLDDCSANLKKTKNKKSDEVYDLLCCNLIPIFIKEKQDAELSISLAEIQELFNNLLKTLN